MNNIFNLSENKKSVIKKYISGGNSGQIYKGTTTPAILYTDILGARQFGNYAFMSLLFIGGLGFLFAGVITYITAPNYVQEISYLPQGILLTFYGTLAISLGVFIYFTLYWNVGSGFNELNKVDQLIRIQRNGYPGKSQKVLLTYEVSDVKKLEIKIVEGINPKQIIYLGMKNEREIPLIFTDQLPSLTKIEQRATLLSNFLKVPLEIKTVKTV